jgi:CHAT domain-containing protein
LSYLPPTLSALGFLRKLNRDIAFLQSAMLVFKLPRTSPGHARHVQLLALALIDRYSETKQQDDLEQAILRFTEAIFLPIPGDPRSLDIIEIFCYLALAISFRAEDFNQSEDVKPCIMYLRYLRGQWYKVPIHFASTVTATFVRILAVRAELEPGNVDRDIEEMADLCDELLNSETPAEVLKYPISAFVVTVDGHFKDPIAGPRMPSEKVIACLQRAHMRLPDSLAVSTTLADSLLNRFFKAPSDDDYNEGMAILDEVITSRAAGDGPSPYRERAMHSAARFAYGLFMAHGKPEHREQAIYRYRSLLDEPLGSHEYPWIRQILSNLHGWRLDRNDSHVTPTFQGALPMTFDSAELPSFQDLATSLLEMNPDEPFPATELMRHNAALHSVRYPLTKRLTDIAYIEDGIKYCRQLLASHPFSLIAPMARSVLPDLLRRAFGCTTKIEYLNGAISAARDHVNTADAQMIRVLSMFKLQNFLLIRFNQLHRREDLNELMQMWPVIAKHERAFSAGQFLISATWPLLARGIGHPSTSTAYEFVMSSLQDFLTFTPTVDNQHSQLIKMGDTVKTLPLNYASYQIHIGQIKQAIQTLERGRALIWSEMRGLRTSIDRIRLADSGLAEHFATVNRDLEALTLAFSSDNDVNGGDSDPERMDPFGHLVVWQRKLLDERDKLISRIQVLPGLDTFLKPPPFEALRSAASHGPVIIINHCEWRSDIIILLRNSPPSLITTSDSFYPRAKKLQDQLLGARKKGLDSHKYEEALGSELKDLYELVGAPVIERLNELNVSEQSRVWWCPTSVFCSLPLHAMGPIPSGVGPPRYFLDLYLPSYTPSLSALIESRKPGLGSRTIGKPSILLVSQPDEKMPQALKEMKAVQAACTQVTTLFSAKTSPAAVLEHLRDHPFTHIVCHGILEPGKPFEASFKLHKGKRLQLLDVVRSQLPDAEFAFLSACHTAELTDESIADEVLHLAAAMQFCGFRSVVGTMWAMADIDGPDLARYFYESLFSSGRLDAERFNERTAEALRDAVKKLRRKRGITLERWVNFVHYGA